MKIKHSTYQIEKFNCISVEEINEWFILPYKFFPSPTTKDFIIYDSDLDTPSTICNELISCRNTNDIIKFQKKYGVLVDPYHYTCGNPLRTFPVLLDYYNNLLPSTYKRNNEFKFCITSVTHWFSYRNELYLLSELNKYSSLKFIASEDLDNILTLCHSLLTNNHFATLLCYEYSNYHDKDEMQKLLLGNPICFFRYLLTYESPFKMQNRKEAIKELQECKELKERIETSLFNFLLDLVSTSNPITETHKIENIKKYIQQIIQDILSFHLRDYTSKHVVPDSTYNTLDDFPALITAIFYCFSMEFKNERNFQKCPACKSLFLSTPYQNNQIYCSKRCASRVSSRAFRERKKNNPS